MRDPLAGRPDWDRSWTGQWVKKNFADWVNGSRKAVNGLGPGLTRPIDRCQAIEQAFPHRTYVHSI